MRIRLYLDEDAMSQGLVAALRRRGIDVVSALDAGMVGHPDEEHLKFAAEQGRVLYSFNVADYHLLHTNFLIQGQSHAGIVLAQQSRYSIGEQTRCLLRLIAAKSAEEMANQVDFLSAWK